MNNFNITLTTVLLWMIRTKIFHYKYHVSHKVAQQSHNVGPTILLRWPNIVPTLALNISEQSMTQLHEWTINGTAAWVNNQWHSCMSEQSMTQLHEWTINDTAAWVNNQWHSCMSEQSITQLHEWTINDTAAWSTETTHIHYLYF